MKNPGKSRVKPDALTSAAMLILIAVMISRIFLVRFIKNEGVGILSAPMDFFMIFYGFFVFGCEHAMTALMRAFQRKRHFQNTKDGAGKLMMHTFAAGCIIGGALLIVCMSLSKIIFYSQISFLAFCAVAVSILLMSVQGTIKGYLEGFGFGGVSLMADIVFAGAALVLPCILGEVFYRYGLKTNALLGRTDLSAGYGAFGAAIGAASASLISFAYLLIQRKVHRTKIEEIVRAGEPRFMGGGPGTGKNVMMFGMVYAFPFLLNVIDERIYLSFAQGRGIAGNHIENWGIYTGGVLPVIVLIITVFVMTHVRGCYELSASISHLDRHEASERLEEHTRYLVIALLPAAMFASVMSDTILRAVYHTPTDAAVSVFKYAAVLIFAAPLAILTSMILLRLRKYTALWMNLILGAVVHFVVLFIMEGALKIEIVSVPAAQGAMFLAVGLVGYLEITHILHIESGLLRVLFLPVVCSGVATLLIYFINNGLINVIGEVLTILACVLIGGIMYLFFLMTLRMLDEYEVERIPGGSFLVILAKGFHLIG